MIATNLHCDWASEIVTREGPTGRFREVVEAVAAAVRASGSALDYGSDQCWAHDRRK